MNFSGPRAPGPCRDPGLGGDRSECTSASPAADGLLRSRPFADAHQPDALPRLAGIYSQDRHRPKGRRASALPLCSATRGRPTCSLRTRSACPGLRPSYGLPCAGAQGIPHLDSSHYQTPVWSSQLPGTIWSSARTASSLTRCVLLTLAGEPELYSVAMTARLHRARRPDSQSQTVAAHARSPTIVIILTHKQLEANRNAK